MVEYLSSMDTILGAILRTTYIYQAGAQTPVIPALRREKQPVRGLHENLALNLVEEGLER